MPLTVQDKILDSLGKLYIALYVEFKDWRRITLVKLEGRVGIGSAEDRDPCSGL